MTSKSLWVEEDEFTFSLSHDRFSGVECHAISMRWGDRNAQFLDGGEGDKIMGGP